MPGSPPQSRPNLHEGLEEALRKGTCHAQILCHFKVEEQGN